VRYIKNALKVVQCGAEEGWKRSVGVFVLVGTVKRTWFGRGHGRENGWTFRKPIVIVWRRIRGKFALCEIWLLFSRTCILPCQARDPGKLVIFSIE
jgi:hypothetical protein